MGIISEYCTSIWKWSRFKDQPILLFSHLSSWNWYSVSFFSWNRYSISFVPGIHTQPHFLPGIHTKPHFTPKMHTRPHFSHEIHIVSRPHQTLWDESSQNRPRGSHAWRTKRCTEPHYSSRIDTWPNFPCEIHSRLPFLPGINTRPHFRTQIIGKIEVYPCIR